MNIYTIIFQMMYLLSTSKIDYVMIYYFKWSVCTQIPCRIIVSKTSWCNTKYINTVSIESPTAKRNYLDAWVTEKSHLCEIPPYIQVHYSYIPITFGKYMTVHCVTSPKKVIRLSTMHCVFVVCYTCTLTLYTVYPFPQHSPYCCS